MRHPSRSLLLILLVLRLASPWATAFDNGINDLHGGTPAPPGTSGGPPGSDPDGHPNGDKNGQGQDGDPVDLFTGQFQTERVDIEIPGRMPLRVRRVYRSNSAYQGMFGRGWNMEFNERLLVLATNGNLLLRRNNSARDEFRRTDASTFVGPLGSYDVIQRQSDGSYVLREKWGTLRFYDTHGRLVEVRDRNWNQLLLTYDPAGKLPINAISDYSHFTNAILVARDYRLIRMEVAHSNALSGRFIQFAYDDNGRVTNATDFTGRTWRYAYDAAGDGTLTAVTTPSVQGFPGGLTTRYVYSRANQNRLASITDPAGRTYLSNRYDSSGRVIRQFHGPATNSFGYPSATVRLYTNGNGYRLERTFDANGNVVSLRQFTAGLRATDPASFLTSFSYETNNEQTKVVLPAGNVIQRTVDARGNVLEVRRKTADTTNGPNDIVSSFSYTANFNEVATSTDPRTNTTVFVYDYENAAFGTTNGNLMRIIFPTVDGVTPAVSYTYNRYGQIESITDAIGAVTRQLYDPATGLLAQRILGFGTPIAATNSFTYDARGNRLSATDPRGHTTRYAYDELDRLVEATGPAPFEFVTRYSYDHNGNRIRLERQTGDASHPWQTTTYGYDVLDRLTTISNDLGHAVNHQYDGEGNHARTIDPNGYVAIRSYDERNLLWRSTDPQTNATEYAYTLNGLLARQTDARGSVTTFAYDRFDRPATNTYPDSSSEQFSYDKAANLVTEVQRNGAQVRYAYNGWNRLTRKTLPDNATVDYSFDAGGRTVRVQDANGTVGYSYDVLGRLASATNVFGGRVGYQYDRSGNRVRLEYPDGSHVAYQYDALDRLARVEDSTGAQVASFAYDPLGRRTRLQYGNGTEAAYGYDQGNRLTNLWHSLTANGTVLAGFDYTYDAAARRRSMRTAGLPAPGLHEYGYDRQYQLRQATYPPGYSFASTGFQYDAKGNRLATTGAASVGYTANHLDQYTNVAGALLTYHSGGALRTHGDRTYGYDAENQLTQAGGPGLDARYRYDATGRRIETEVNGVITRFAYDGGRILGEYDAAGNLLRKLIHGDGVDEPLRLESASAKFYYHADALGSIHCLTDASGAKVESYAYDVFGKPAALSALGNRYYWTAREYDAETQLYHHRIRQYDPGLGRFLQPDPLGYLAGLNLYRYCDNDPVNWLDPYGLDKGGGWGPLDWLQGALDIGGLIPVIGEPLDLINAGISAARGDYVAAGLSLGAMLPVGGQAATAAKLGLKYGDEVASAANNVGRYANHTDAQFLREIASRAEAKVGGTGAVAGTHKHAYADRLLERYQSMTGQRQNLLREQSYLNGQPVPRGTAGSARPDVYDPGSGAVYDYKFTVNPGRGIPARQQGNNARNLPNVTSQTEINP